MVGTFLDSIRNLIEHVADCVGDGPLNWDFFFYGDRDKVAQLDENYFAYYTAKANYVIGLVVAFLYLGLFWYFNPPWVVLAIFSGVIVAAICLLDAISLRIEIKHLVRKPTAVAHFGVYTRLKPSSTIGGVGVFAIRDIPKETNIFSGDTTAMREIDQKDLKHADPALKKLYCDFCVFKDGKIMGPVNFNSLTVGWYLNHSRQPNVRCGADYDFFAMRDIKDGEELTVDYSTFDDRPPPDSDDRIACKP